jgi:putative transposase
MHRCPWLRKLDDYSHECVGQIVVTSITGQWVAHFLNGLIEQRQKPQTIVFNNGTEFTSKVMFFWSKENNVTLSFIQPGKPTQNAFVESFTGKFKAGCLNLHWFRDQHDAKEEIEKWCCHDNYVRPHSALNYLSPVQYVNQAEYCFYSTNN